MVEDTMTAKKKFLTPVAERVESLESAFRKADKSSASTLMAFTVHAESMQKEYQETHEALLAHMRSEIAPRQNSLACCVDLLDSELSAPDSWLHQLPRLLDDSMNLDNMKSKINEVTELGKQQEVRIKQEIMKNQI